VKQERLLQETRTALAKTGFFLSSPHGQRGLSFDVVARRDDTLLIIKVFLNVDALSRETALELKGIARTLEGSPLVVGERTGSGALEDGVIYSRFGIPILARSTLLEFLEELAEIGGVSRRTIQMYLEGMAATLDVAMRLEDVLRESLALPIDPFRFQDDPRGVPGSAPRLERFERELYQRLERLGYAVLPTVRSPFDALSQHEATTYLTGVGGPETALDRKAEVVSDISHVVEKGSVMFVVRRSVRMSIRGVPVIAREELRRAKDTDDVEEMISERKG
jgi:putative transcriptional regulator